MRRTPASQRGITLIEVLMSLAIVGLVAGIGILGVGAQKSARMRGGAVMIAGAIGIWRSAGESRALMVISVLVGIVVYDQRRRELARADLARAEEIRAESRSRREADNEQRTGQLDARVNELGLPIGWVFHPEDPADPRAFPDEVLPFVLKLFGLLLTGFAISQGAPFWFDLLNRFMVVRSTVKPAEKGREQPSKDRPALEPSPAEGRVRPDVESA